MQEEYRFQEPVVFCWQERLDRRGIQMQVEIPWSKSLGRRQESLVLVPHRDSPVRSVCAGVAYWVEFSKVLGLRRGRLIVLVKVLRVAEPAAAPAELALPAGAPSEESPSAPSLRELSPEDEVPDVLPLADEEGALMVEPKEPSRRRHPQPLVEFDWWKQPKRLHFPPSRLRSQSLE